MPDCTVGFTVQVVLLLISLIAERSVYFWDVARSVKLWTHADMPFEATGMRDKFHSEAAKARSISMAISKNLFGFMVPVRSRSSFIDGSYEPPESATPVREKPYSALQQLLYVFIGEIRYTAWQCFNIALLTGIIGTVGTWLEIAEKPGMWNDFYIEFCIPLLDNGFVGDYMFLPVMMIVFALNNATNRWMDEFQNGLCIQGRIHDLGLILAGAFPDDSPKTWATKFIFFRYITAAHYLNYFTLDPRIGRDPNKACLELSRVGLLLPEEVPMLRAAHPSMRDNMIQWVSVLFHEQVKAGIISECLMQPFQEQLGRLRGHMGTIHDDYDLYPSNLHLSMLGLTTKVLVLSLAFKYTMQSFNSKLCVDAAAMIGSFFIIFGYIVILHMTSLLEKSPFDHKGDVVNIDALLCLSDRVLYRALRASADMPKTLETTDLPEELLATTDSIVDRCVRTEVGLGVLQGQRLLQEQQTSVAPTENGSKFTDL